VKLTGAVITVYPSNSTAIVFYDQKGNPTSLYRLVRAEPDWADSRIRVGIEDAKKVVELQAENTRLNKIISGKGSRFTDEETAEIQRLYFSRQKKQVELASMYKCSQGTISTIVSTGQSTAQTKRSRT